MSGNRPGASTPVVGRRPVRTPTRTPVRTPRAGRTLHPPPRREHHAQTPPDRGPAAAIVLPIALALPAQSHGFVNQPPSRSALCGADAVPWDCGDIQWEPQSVEGPKGFPGRGPADGTICAGGDGRWAPLDNPRGGAWPTTKVTAGQQLTFTWEIEAATPPPTSSTT
ncbi:lytic polysaccharide monooxygenase [Kitasatospora sp. Ki12]